MLTLMSMCYFVYVYFTTVSASQTTTPQTTGWLVSVKLEGIKKESVLT
jgi:hypothetical protein